MQAELFIGSTLRKFATIDTMPDGTPVPAFAENDGDCQLWWYRANDKGTKYVLGRIYYPEHELNETIDRIGRLTR